MSQTRKRFSDIFFTRIFSDEEGEKIVSTYLKTILYVTLVVLPLFASYKVIYFSVLYPVDYILIVLTVIFGILLYFTNRGKVKISSILFILTTWTALTFMAAYSDGVKDISVVAYIIVIFLATLLVGARLALIITIISIISVWVMGFIPPKNGFMPPGDIPLIMSIDYTVLFIIIIASIILIARSYHYSFERINRELLERRKAEEKLSKNEQILKEKNEEMNRSNLQMARINEELRDAKEKAEESDRLKTAFIQNISHEIRTPMNGIVGFIELLQHPNSDFEKKAEYIGIINSCTQQLATLVNDLIDISKIETGTIELQNSEFSMNHLVKELNEAFSRPASEKGLSFKISNEVGNIQVRSDYSKIRQIMNHLVSNAIKFTPKGNVSVKLSKSGSEILLSVADTGIGIKESDRRVIFDRFRQAEIGLSRSYGGSGLGLAISKGNVEFLGGKIWFESQAGKGSLFAFAIPVEFISEPGPDKHSTPSVKVPEKLKIMIAEDDEINYMYLKELLGASDCIILWARDGLEAVEMFSREPDFDIVLMDLKMPIMNGYEATEKIKKIKPEIPVIAVTAFALPEDIDKATGNFAGYVVKPIEKSDLLSKISTIMT